MNSKQLIERFKKYSIELAANGKFERINPEDPMAMLWGDDEVTLDVQKGQIIIPQFGAIACEAIEPPAPPEWYAICNDFKEEGWSVVLGYGDPYAPEWIDKLPGRNGVIFATPASMAGGGITGGNRAQRRANRKRR